MARYWWVTDSVRGGRLIQLAGSLCLVGTFLLLLYVSAGASFGPVLGTIEAAVFGLMFAVSLAILGIGSAVKEHKPWARLAGVIIASVLLVLFPVGTVIGGFALYYLVKGWHEQPWLASTSPVRSGRRPVPSQESVGGQMKVLAAVGLVLVYGWSAVQNLLLLSWAAGMNLQERGSRLFDPLMQAVPALIGEVVAALGIVTLAATSIRGLATNASRSTKRWFWAIVLAFSVEAWRLLDAYKGNVLVSYQEWIWPAVTGVLAIWAIVEHGRVDPRGIASRES